MLRKTHAVAAALLSVFSGFGSTFVLAADPTEAPAKGAADQSWPSAAIAAADRQERPVVEVAFVLDSTGSMGGLIEGAKQKIWSIANSIIAQPGKPRVRIGLIGYRDRGDAFVTQVHGLSDDIDTVFKNLTAFRADGGGDEPESVNQALHDAVSKIEWSKDPTARRIIFLVGDAPPHMDYSDDTKYPVTCKLANELQIVINAVQCGSNASTTVVWKDIATLGKGKFLAVPQDGGVVAISCPQDAELASLSAQLAQTVVPYGSKDQQAGAREKAAANGAPAASGAAREQQAARAQYNALDGGRAIQGGGDLVWDSANGVVKLDDLKRDQLSPELSAMAPEALQKLIADRSAVRSTIQEKIDKLSTERAAYLKAEQEKQSKAGAGSQFDQQVQAAVAEQVK